MPINYPSELVEIDLPDHDSRRKVLIPGNELFRFQNIFLKHEYGISPHFLPSGKIIIVDIGANIGLFALYMKTIKPQCSVICFEPCPDTLALLNKNTAGQSDISIYPIALSNRNGDADMLIHPVNTGENSIRFEQKADAETVRVEVMDAGSMFQQIGLTYIDILKIDTEGCEIEILESIRSYLPYVGIVMIEYHCENDRRKIDQLLPGHLLMGATVTSPEIGTLKYINARLVK